VTAGQAPRPAAARAPAPLARWAELNDRQQGTLTVIYDLDQEAEGDRRRAAASGAYDRRPASEWRAVDFAHDPSDRDLFGWTEMQLRLASRGWDNQGNGSTVAALAERGLLTRSSRPAGLGMMLTVMLTRAGRAAARAGTSTTLPGRTRKPALSPRAWEVLALLWAAGQRGGKGLEWTYSNTIERVLIDRHEPPLAERAPGAYRITDRGREFYREHYAAHAAAHPGVSAPHPDGPQSEPWPAAADRILGQHRQLYRALCTAWQAASDAHQAASTEAGAPTVPVPEGLPAAVAEQSAERHQLWQDTARQRAGLASSHAGDLGGRCARAARAWAVAALAAYAAAVAGASPLGQLQPPADSAGDWDEPRLAPPAETGIHAIDAEARKLHAAAAGTPLRRRGPAPRRRGRATSPASRPEHPGRELAALAAFLHGHAAGGALMRRLHPAAGPRSAQDAGCDDGPGGHA
jgi:hypothetical protein